MVHHHASSEAYTHAIAINVSALQDRLREGLMRAEAASEASAAGDIEIAMGALFGMDALLVEARALHQAALILHRMHYNNLAAAESAPLDSTVTEADLVAQFDRYCTEEHLGERADAIELLHRKDLTAEQRRWLSDFVRRWEAMLKRARRAADKETVMSSFHPPFITSLREPLQILDASGELQGYLPRHGVWTWDRVRLKYQCTDTGDDLHALRQRYRVPPERVFPIPSEGAPALANTTAQP